MPNTTVVLTAESDRLIVEVDMQLEDYMRIQYVVIEHFNRMAQQQFPVEW